MYTKLGCWDAMAGEETASSAATAITMKPVIEIRLDLKAFIVSSVCWIQTLNRAANERERVEANLDFLGQPNLRFYPGVRYINDDVHDHVDDCDE